MIRLEDIVVRFDKFEALHKINVHVKEGEFFTFLGPSGCGKTTTLRTITGFIQPAEGKVWMQGRDITNVPIEKRNIGIVFQSYALFPTMTVRKNIAYGLTVKHVKRDEIKQRVQQIAERVNLTDDQLDKAVSQLSGGQQQRVAIARALVTNPTIICMDEPLSNLDAKLRVNLRNELKRMQREFGITTIYVTHDQEEALTLSDRIAVFNNGYIEQIGTPNDVYNHSATDFVANFIGDINRLDEEIVNRMQLSPGKKHYIRLERIGVKKDDEGKEDKKDKKDKGEKKDKKAKPGKALKLHGIIESQEYYGLSVKYSIQAAGQTLKVVEKNDGINIHQPGEHVILRIDPEDVMSY
ncbi:MAG: ABC transporter ATP-binding protein [Clostridia bacterium]|nr:ABC transporter ATP-binding protein [Clostridia bacterium]